MWRGRNPSYFPRIFLCLHPDRTPFPSCKGGAVITSLTTDDLASKVVRRPLGLRFLQVKVTVHFVWSTFQTETESGTLTTFSRYLFLPLVIPPTLRVFCCSTPTHVPCSVFTTFQDHTNLVSHVVYSDLSLFLLGSLHRSRTPPVSAFQTSPFSLSLFTVSTDPVRSDYLPTQILHLVL